jgi:hypothetical protein
VIFFQNHLAIISGEISPSVGFGISLAIVLPLLSGAN